jgi:hypothetical protein
MPRHDLCKWFPNPEARDAAVARASEIVKSACRTNPFSFVEVSCDCQRKFCRKRALFG